MQYVHNRWYDHSNDCERLVLVVTITFASLMSFFFPTNPFLFLPSWAENPNLVPRGWLLLPSLEKTFSPIISKALYLLGRRDIYPGDRMSPFPFLSVCSLFMVKLHPYMCYAWTFQHHGWSIMNSFTEFYHASIMHFTSNCCIQYIFCSCGRSVPDCRDRAGGAYSGRELSYHDLPFNYEN